MLICQLEQNVGNTSSPTKLLISSNNDLNQVNKPYFTLVS